MIDATFETNETKKQEMKEFYLEMVQVYAKQRLLPLTRRCQRGEKKMKRKKQQRGVSRQFKDDFIPLISACVLENKLHWWHCAHGERTTKEEKKEIASSEPTRQWQRYDKRLTYQFRKYHKKRKYQPMHVLRVSAKKSIRICNGRKIEKTKSNQPPKSHQETSKKKLNDWKKKRQATRWKCEKPVCACVSGYKFKHFTYLWISTER